MGKCVNESVRKRSREVLGGGGVTGVACDFERVSLQGVTLQTWRLSCEGFVFLLINKAMIDICFCECERKRYSKACRFCTADSSNMYSRSHFNVSVRAIDE